MIIKFKLKKAIMTKQEQPKELQETFQELRTLIKEGMAAEGIEETIVQMGISLFQIESVLQEFLARLVSTQRLLVDKNVITETELEQAVNKTLEEQAQIIQQATQQFLEENQKDVS